LKEEDKANLDRENERLREEIDGRLVKGDLASALELTRYRREFEVA
jgi:hypothetical protein